MTKWSEYYQKEIDTAVFTVEDGRFVIRHCNGETSMPINTSFEDLKKEWIRKKGLQVQSQKIIESFEGLSIEEVLKHPKYSHSRYQNYGIRFYCRVPDSPTGVAVCGGCKKEELDRVKNCLSPTENLSGYR